MLRHRFQTHLACLTLLAAGLTGCTGSTDAPGSGAPATTPPSSQPTTEVPPAACDASQMLGPRVVRLAGTELRDHVRASLPGVDETLLAAINLQAEHLTKAAERSLSGAEFGAYFAAIKPIAEAFVQLAPEMEPCRSSSADACLQAATRAAVTRLFRAAPQDQEWSNLSASFQRLSPSQGTAQAAAALLSSALLSPQLLYQTERGEAALAAGSYALSKAEAVSRARFALTGQAPLPAELSQLESLQGDAFKAELGRLAATWAQDGKFAERVLDHAAARFDVSHLPEVDRSDAAFTPAVQTALTGEFREYVRDTLLSPTGSFEQLFVGTPARVFPGLEGIYGSEPSISGSARRKGVLGLASLLTARAGAANSDPVKRGLLVRVELLCEAMPPPIADADFSKVTVTEDMQTRERFETLAQAPTCKSCHEVINPPGYLFEEFDQVGRYRTMEKGRPINATGTITPFFGQAYPGVGPWDGIVPLAEWLSRSPEARLCFASHFASYALSDAIPGGNQNCSLQTLAARFVASGRVSELVEDLVKSELFLYRARSTP
jgi:hypothetical protein